MEENQRQTYTPMMQQYLKIKEDYADAIVFFRLGDFYEMFFDDAIVASKVLEIALTSRDAGAKVPMCGIPYHAAKAYIHKLIDKGFKIAIAEQMTEAGKGLVEREVVRLITPGTLLEEGILDDKSNNFIGSLALTEKGYCLTYVDLSTGESFLTDHLEKQEALDLIESLDIKELVLSQQFDQQLIKQLESYQRLISYHDQRLLVEHKYLDHLEKDQKRVASQLIQYLMATQKQSIEHLMPFEIVLKEEHMVIDYKLKRHLEIDVSLTNQPKTTLLYWLDQTQTAMGSRYLKSLLNYPLLNPENLNQRYDYIEALMPYQHRQQLSEHLKYIYDVNRIVSRVAFQTANAKDLEQLKKTLEYIPLVKEALLAFEHPLLDAYAAEIDDHHALKDLLETAIEENPPLTIKEGNIIKAGYNNTLDQLKDIADHGASWLLTFEEQEKERTGIKNLRVGYNRVFGYYIEVSKGNVGLIKESFGYDRKQTLSNSERYITPELKEKEDDILHAKEKSMALEYELFKDIRDTVGQHTFSLQKLSLSVAKLDALLSLAKVAFEHHYVRPILTDQRNVKIVKGRHPVVEHFVTFVKNDVTMKPGEIFLITGPNMSGKSTYMRMFALIIFMAQIGSFVPAESALIPIYDAIYTRIGSSDDLSGGKSTFMVEMVESNEALTKATNHSLILFDEIGRGTATYDGMALAQGMIEYIHEKIGAQTLFSTHYHELTSLDESLNRLTNLYVKAEEKKETMIFLHQVALGKSDRSYGLQVAALAHLPKALLSRSKQILNHLEQKKTKIMMDLFNYDQYEQTTEETFSQKELLLIEEIKKLDTDQLTPIEALLLIKHYQSLLKNQK
ncbi:MAG: DNA mismatch repair protein MutS [Acholeplasmataceae bacterium]